MTTDVRLVIDVANVMGSTPDGWWRDRAGAATRLLAALPVLVASTVRVPDGGTGRRAPVRGAPSGLDPVRIESIVAVVEGAARSAEAPGRIEVVRATADGDAAIVEIANAAAGEASAAVLVVTADRGLRARLDPAVLVGGPGWLNGLIGR